MNYKEMLLSKNGLATHYLSREFLKFSLNQKIPTVTEFCDKLNLSRGTVQNSIKFLQDNKAIELVSKGHLGTFLEEKNTKILLEFAGITSIVGVMPLPYSRKYEGFATGLISTMENRYNIPCSLAYMRGARNRVSMLLANRYDFAV
ncbi:MAG: YhfZ family protein, partial [Longicatena sp.]